MTVSPYYSADGITIYHGDCAEIAPTLGRFDLLCTDPPYGIGSKWQGGKQSSSRAAIEAATARNSWDMTPASSETLSMLRSICANAVIWGGNFFEGLPPSRGWLVWNKPERGFTMAEAELAWTTRDDVIRTWDGARLTSTRGDCVYHPTQKPLELMAWCISKFRRPTSVLDPFMGSGTTLRACKDLGIRCVGIEREERYCEIAARRLGQGVLALGHGGAP